MITVKRSCNSSNIVGEEKITFNSFVIILTEYDAKAFRDIHLALHDDETMDRVLMTKTLEKIIEEGIDDIMRWNVPVENPPERIE